MVTQQKLKALFYRTEYYGTAINGGVSVMHKGMIDGLNELQTDTIYVTSGQLINNLNAKQIQIPYYSLFKNLPEVLTLPHIYNSYTKTKKIIESEQPDFIFQHHHDFNFGGTLLKNKFHLPFLLHCDFIQLWIKKNWGKLYFEKLLKYGEEIQWENADKIFVVSNKTKSIMINEYGLDANKIIVNPNAVNTKIFNPNIDTNIIRKKLNLENKFIVVFTGTFGPYHGLDFLTNTIPILKDKIPNIFFLFVGDGEYRKKIEEELITNKCSNFAHITGYVDYSEVPLYMASADVLVSPCITENKDLDFFNSPIKLFEYMGMGKPIVATNVGQQAEVIKNNHNGLLCEERQPEALANCIYQIFKDKDLADRLGIQARLDAVEKHDWKVNAQIIIDAYNSIVKK